MIKTQTWKPDTCGCVITQQWDYGTRPATLDSEELTVACPEHSTAGAVTTENVKKNQGYRAMKEATNERDADIIWEINVARDIIISLLSRDLTAGEQTLISADLTARGDTVLETRDNFVRFR